MLLFSKEGCIMECKYCKEEIKQGAKVCPHCRRTQWSDGFVLFIILFGFFFMLMGLVLMLDILP